MTGAEKFKKLCESKKNVWMGILNLTPDSFSDGGLYHSFKNAINRAKTLIHYGADILDIGGASTRPFALLISPEEELNRVYQIISELKKSIPSHILISLDTYSPIVAHTLAKDGLIDIINDIYSAKKNEKIYDDIYMNNAEIAANFNLGYIVMHMQGAPSTMQINPKYDHCSNEVLAFLSERASFAESLGVKYIAVDPGIGFGKTVQHNLELLSKEFLDKLIKLNYPILIGLSRKSFLSKVSLEPYDESTRDIISKKFEFQCFSNGVQIIRSHIMPNENLNI